MTQLNRNITYGESLPPRMYIGTALIESSPFWSTGNYPYGPGPWTQSVRQEKCAYCGNSIDECGCGAKQPQKERR